jgi:hypothetical protein
VFALLYCYTFLGGLFTFLGLILASTYTISWSDIPGQLVYYSARGKNHRKKSMTKPIYYATTRERFGSLQDQLYIKFNNYCTKSMAQMIPI